MSSRTGLSPLSQHQPHMQEKVILRLILLIGNNPGVSGLVAVYSIGILSLL